MKVRKHGRSWVCDKCQKKKHHSSIKIEIPFVDETNRVAELCRPCFIEYEFEDEGQSIEAWLLKREVLT